MADLYEVLGVHRDSSFRKISGGVRRGDESAIALSVQHRGQGREASGR